MRRFTFACVLSCLVVCFTSAAVPVWAQDVAPADTPTPIADAVAAATSATPATASPAPMVTMTPKRPAALVGLYTSRQAAEPGKGHDREAATWAAKARPGARPR